MRDTNPAFCWAHAFIGLQSNTEHLFFPWFKTHRSTCKPLVGSPGVIPRRIAIQPHFHSDIGVGRYQEPYFDVTG